MAEEKEIAGRGPAAEYVWLGLWAVMILGLPLLDGGTTYIPVTGLRLLVLIMTAAWAMFGLRQKRFVIVSGWYNIPILIFFLLSMSSLVFSAYLYGSMYWYLNILVYIAVFYLMLQTVSPGRDVQGGRLRFVIYVYILSGVLQGLWALYESMSGALRPNGTFFNPAEAAGYFAGIGPLALSFLLYGRAQNLKPPRETGRRQSSSLPVERAVGKPRVSSRSQEKFLLFLSLAIIIIGVIASGSRAAVALLLALGCVVFVRWRVLSVAGLVLAAALVMLIPNPLGQRIRNLSATDPYAYERLNIWQGGLAMIRDHPTGVGLGMYKYYSQRYIRSINTLKVGRYGRYADTAHNEYLHLAAEMSPLAPLLLMVLAFWPMLPGIFQKPRSPGPDLSRPGRDPSEKGSFGAVKAGLACSLLGISVHGLVDSNLHNPAIAVEAAMLLAMLVCQLGRERPTWVREYSFQAAAPRFLKGLTLFAAALFFSLFVYLGVTFGLYEKYSHLPDPMDSANHLDRLARYLPAYAPLFGDIASRLYIVHEHENGAMPNLELLGKAVAEMKIAQSLNPENYAYPRGLGLYLMTSGKFMEQTKNKDVVIIYQDAEQYFIRALSLNPSDVHVRRWLAALYLRMNRPDPAEDQLIRALAYEPYYFGARLDLVELMVKTGRLERAKAEFDTLQKQMDEKINTRYFDGYQKSLLLVEPAELNRLKRQLSN